MVKCFTKKAQLLGPQQYLVYRAAKKDINENYDKDNFKIMRDLGYGFWEGLVSRFRINNRTQTPEGADKNVVLNGKSFAIAMTLPKKTLKKSIEKLKIKMHEMFIGVLVTEGQRGGD